MFSVLVIGGMHPHAMRRTIAGAGECLWTVGPLVGFVAGVLVDVELEFEMCVR